MANPNIAQLAAISGVFNSPAKQAALLVSRNDEKRFMNNLRTYICNELSKSSKVANFDSSTVLRDHQQYVFTLDLQDYFIEKKADLFINDADKILDNQNKTLKKKLEEEINRIKDHIDAKSPMTLVVTGFSNSPLAIRRMAAKLVASASANNITTLVPVSINESTASNKDASIIENALHIPGVFAIERKIPRKGLST